MSRGEVVRVLPIRWRHVQPGWTILGHEDTRWTVHAVTPHRGRLRVEIRRDGVSPWRGDVDLDEAARVLVPAPLAAAMILLRDGLGAQLIAPEREVAA